MTETLKCPECSAPLEYPPQGGPTMRCPYCNSIVLLPQNSGAAPSPMAGQPAELAEVIAQLRAGRKIDAIRIYRQVFGVDLATAKSAVERYAIQDRIGSSPAVSRNYKPVDPARASSYAARVGLGVAAVIFAVTIVTIVLITAPVRRQAMRTQAGVLASVPSPVFTTPARHLIATPAEPTFAHQILEFGSEGIGAGQFTDARSIAIDGNGQIYVGEYGGGRIQVFDARGKFLSAWSIGQNRYLADLAADRHGIVYAIDSPSIYRFEGASGKPLGKVEETFDDNSLVYCDAVMGLDGDLYALESNRNVVDIGSDGKVKRILNLAEKTRQDVSFQRLAMIGTGQFYLLSESKGVFAFSADGKYLNRFGGGSMAKPVAGRLSSPRGIAADGKGRIFVSDVFRAIQVFDSDGNFLDSFGGADVVFGMAINDQDEIYGCFRNKYCVRKFVLDKP